MTLVSNIDLFLFKCLVQKETDRAEKRILHATDIRFKKKCLCFVDIQFGVQVLCIGSFNTR